MLKAGENEQLATAWQQTLSRLGIAVSIRSVDAAQFQQRLTGFDFDVVPFLYASSLSPGVEQVARWGSVSAMRRGPSTRPASRTRRSTP